MMSLVTPGARSAAEGAMHPLPHTQPHVPCPMQNNSAVIGATSEQLGPFSSPAHLMSPPTMFYSSAAPPAAVASSALFPTTTVQLTTQITTHTHTADVNTAPSMQTCIAHTTQTVHTHSPVDGSRSVSSTGSRQGDQQGTTAGGSSQPMGYQAYVQQQQQQQQQQSIQSQAQAIAQAHWMAHAAQMHAAAVAAVTPLHMQQQQQATIPYGYHPPMNVARPTAYVPYASYAPQQTWYQQVQQPHLQRHQHQHPPHDHHRRSHLRDESRAQHAQLQRVLDQSFEQAVVHPRAASAAAVAQLPLARADADTIAAQPACPICITDFDRDDECIYMPCRHSFHNACLRTWLRLRNTCPCCRHQLETDDPAYNRTIRRGGDDERRSEHTVARTGESRSSRNELAENDMPEDDDEEEEDDDDDLGDASGSDMEDDEEEIDDTPALPPTERTYPAAFVAAGAQPNLHASSVMPAPASPAVPSALLQYHTLHHLQSLAAAEFSALAQQAQVQQQHQQQLIHYQQQLWNAQRDLQAAIAPTVSGHGVPLATEQTRVQSHPHPVTVAAPSWTSTFAPLPPLASSLAPSSALPPPHAVPQLPAPTALCALCTSSDLSTLHSASCVLSCSHSYHLRCWSAYLLQQQQQHPDERDDAALMACPQCLQQQPEQHRSRSVSAASAAAASPAASSPPPCPSSASIIQSSLQLPECPSSDRAVTRRFAYDHDSGMARG